MATPSPLDISDPSLRFTVKANGSFLNEAYTIVSIKVNHELNKISSAIIIINDGSIETGDLLASDSADLIPGVTIVITAGFGDAAEEIIFDGLIIRQAVEISANGRFTLIVTCKHKAVSMTINRTEAEFLAQTDSSIMSSILQNYSQLTATVTSTGLKHEGMFQKSATDWDFILSRADFLGFVISMDGAALKIAPPAVTGTAVLRVGFGESMRSFRAELNAEMQVPAITTNSWNLKTQVLSSSTSTEPAVNAQGNLTAKKLSAALGQTPLTLTSGTPMTTEELMLWANSTLLRTRLSALKGEVSFIGSALAKTGKLITLAGVGARYNGDAFISAVTHTLDEGKWETLVRFGLDDTLLSERASISSMPAMGMLPAINGLQIAVVKQLSQDPESEHRILVTIPSAATSPVTLWARYSNSYATAGAGLAFLPEPGDEVVIAYLESDPRYPVILGSLYSSKNPTPNPATDENNYKKMLMTKSGIKLSFDEENKVLIITTPASNMITLSDKEKTVSIADQNGNSVKMTSSGINFESGKDITLKATGGITLDATGSIAITSKQDLKLGGMNIAHTAQIGFTAKGNATAEISASGQTTVKGAIVMIN